MSITMTRDDLGKMITAAAADAIDKALSRPEQRPVAFHKAEIISKLQSEETAVALAKSVASGEVSSPLTESEWTTVLTEQAKSHFPEFDEGLGWSDKRTAKAVSRYLSTATGTALFRAATVAKFGSAVIPRQRDEEPLHKVEREALEHPLIGEIQTRADTLWSDSTPAQRFARALMKDDLAKSLYRVVSHAAMTTEVAKMNNPAGRQVASGGKTFESFDDRYPNLTIEEARALGDPRIRARRTNWRLRGVGDPRDTEQRPYRKPKPSPFAGSGGVSGSASR
jgi:hypothetical protein